MSYMSVDGVRSATKHAGIPAIETSGILASAGGVIRILGTTQSAQKIKVLSYTISPSSDGNQFNFGTSSAGTGTASGLTSHLYTQAGVPIIAPLNVPFGYFTTNAGDDLVVSSTTGIAGYVVYQREY